MYDDKQSIIKVGELMDLDYGLFIKGFVFPVLCFCVVEGAVLWYIGGRKAENNE